MRFIADLQIHSKYSRATSKDMVLEQIDCWAGNKGILVMGTGDFTHPAWFNEIKTKLEPAEPGLFKLKKEFKWPTVRGSFSETRFMLTVEISGIYSRLSKSGVKKVYRIHNMIFSPDMETAEKINTQLSWVGNLASDGRPILGLDSEELAKIVFNINPEAVIVPAHAWTPWFSLFGSMSGFDSIEECFGQYAKNIFAVETGLSSDPAMNWRLSQLDNISLISNSDSHSLPRIGREANIFDTNLSYDGIIEAIKDGVPAARISADNNQRESAKFVATIEFFPEEGKYHFDGHRDCGIVFSPEESKKHKNLCPKCGKKLTIGVLNRVEVLADRPLIDVKVDGYLHKYENRVPYYNLVPLDEVIAKVYHMGTASRKVKDEYENLIKRFGGEFPVLMEKSAEELRAGGVDEKIIAGITAIREGKIRFDPPGYDGEYGKMVFTELNLSGQKEDAQKSLF
ncbi:DNA helicase UvrD [Candidatus Wolfebacteria bacterium]|nr:DNA helicase UvrD [Candidatus Wolfebacteria bacterium]